VTIEHGLAGHGRRLRLPCMPPVPAPLEALVGDECGRHDRSIPLPLGL
jgi:hypothetical protein